MDLCNSARRIKRDGTFLERLNLKQSAAIGLVFQVAPRAGRTLGAIGLAMLGLEMMGRGRGSLPRSHVVMVGQGASFQCR